MPGIDNDRPRRSKRMMESEIINDKPVEKKKHPLVGYGYILACVVGGLAILALIGTML